jgi:hypothetical protein
MSLKFLNPPPAMGKMPIQRGMDFQTVKEEGAPPDAFLLETDLDSTSYCSAIHMLGSQSTLLRLCTDPSIDGSSSV